MATVFYLPLLRSSALSDIPFSFPFSKELVDLTGNMFWTSPPPRDPGVQRHVGKVGTIDSLQTH